MAFVVTALIIVVTPGTGALYTISTGLSRGARASVVAAFGFAASVRRHLVDRPAIVTRVRKVFAASFVALNVRLAVITR